MGVRCFTFDAVKIVPLISMDISSCHSSLKGNKQNIIGANTVQDVSRLCWTAGGRSNSFVLLGSRIYIEEKKYAQNSSRLWHNLAKNHFEPLS